MGASNAKKGRGEKPKVLLTPLDVLTLDEFLLMGTDVNVVPSGEDSIPFEV